MFMFFAAGLAGRLRGSGGLLFVKLNVYVLDATLAV
jgi:hypothetical protein